MGDRRDEVVSARILYPVVLGAAIVLGACSSVAASPSPSADPNTEGTRQVDRFFNLLQTRNVEGLAAFLSPAFQIQRADGSGADRFNYVAIEPAVITRYRITQLRATLSGDVLVVRYLADVEGTVNRDPYAPGPAPRLSVFVWNGSDWQLAAHANFNPLDGPATPSPSPT